MTKDFLTPFLTGATLCRKNDAKNIACPCFNSPYWSFYLFHLCWSSILVQGEINEAANGKRHYNLVQCPYVLTQAWYHEG